VAARRLVLVGFGPVGRAFARLVDQRADGAAAGLQPLDIVAIATQRGTWRKAAAGANTRPSDVADAIEAGTPISRIPGVGVGDDGAAAIATVDADMLIDASPTDLLSGEPGTAHLRMALERGWDVVTASKGALVVHGPELIEAARQRGVGLLYGAAAAAALPTLDVARWGLTGSRVERIDGILNGTSNAILSAMRREGVAYDEALARAQAAGIAERDPRLDVSGRDTAAKLVLIAGVVWGVPTLLADAQVTGIEAVTRAEVSDAATRGGAIRLVGSAWLEDGVPRVQVEPVELPADHALAHVDGAEKAITFTTDTLGRITVAGGASSPRAAAAAILRDVLNLEGASRHGQA
jgi:homoserine dehydrogenase